MTFARTSPISAVAFTLALFTPNLWSDDEFNQRATKLFRGETLVGWEGNAHWFHVDGVTIVAGSLEKKIPHNEFLCTTEKYGDFELRLEAKLTGEGNNAGVQFRSKRVPGSTEVSGYQMDIGGAFNRSVWGALYDESRRNKMLAEPTPEVSKSLKTDDWTEMRLICRGPRIQIFVNGTQTIDYVETDDTIPQDGVIGLQIHSGPPSEALYRNIRLLTLTSEPTPAPASK